MHLIDCPHCGRRELRGARSLHTVATALGDVIATTCRDCGAEVAAASSRMVRPPLVAAVA